MKKLALSTMIVFVLSVSALAQSEIKMTFSIGPELSFPTGSFNSTHQLGIGGSVQGEYHVKDNLKATATFGIFGYPGQSSVLNMDKADQRIIPLRIGAKYYLNEGFYGGAQLGVAFLSNYALHSGTAFAYSPLMLGYEFNLKSQKAFDATVKYDAYTGAGGTIGTLGLRVAYIF